MIQLTTWVAQLKSAYFVCSRVDVTEELYIRQTGSRAYSDFHLLTFKNVNVKNPVWFPASSCPVMRRCDVFPGVTALDINPWFETMRAPSELLRRCRKWSSQSCRRRPRTPLPWQPTRQKATAPAANPSWSRRLAQVCLSQRGAEISECLCECANQKKVAFKVSRCRSGFVFL